MIDLRTWAIVQRCLGSCPWLSGVLWLGLLAWAGCGDALVGGSCMPGYAVCDGACVDLQGDPRHCGACDADCGRLACIAGVCSESPSGSAADAGSGGAQVGDADSSRPQDSPRYELDLVDMDGDEAALVCDVGRASCSDGCFALNTDPSHCGRCEVTCAGDELCSAGACVPACEDGLAACAGACVDLQTDPRHCGGCGRACASGICEQGRCADAVPGHLVMFGHNYARSNNFQSALLGNAVFLGRGVPVRTLVYEGAALATSVQGVYAAIDTVAAATGREWQVTAGSAELITLQLEQADVFVLHAQQQHSASALRQLGERWARALTTFLSRGGVVVAIDGPSSSNGGTFELLEAAGLFVGEGLEAVDPSTDLTVASPGLGIAVRVGRRYRAESSTVGFVAPQLAGGQVIVRAGALPIVLHGVFE